MFVYVIDVGTSSMRGILYDPNASVLFKKQISYHPDYYSDGRVEQDPAVWLQSLEQLLKWLSLYCRTKGIRPDAISITSQRSSVIPLSSDKSPLAPAIMWQDKRTRPYEESLAGYNSRVFSFCGSRVNSVFSACKMKWLKEHSPQLYQKAFKLAVIPDYLIWHMTGNLCTDYTYGSRSLLMGLSSCQWEPELLDIFGIRADKLCPLIPPGTICGHLTKELAYRCGLTAAIPVVTAGGDQQCAALGLGILGSGQAEITAGTGAFILAGTDRLPQPLRPDVILNASCIPGQHLLESSILACCSAFDWFLRTFYCECEEGDYHSINQEAAQALHSPVIALPYFQGRATPDWNTEARASFHNIALCAGRGDFARALLEGICYEIRCNLETLESYCGPISSLKICGGLTKNQDFAQMEADILNRPLGLFSNEESTSLGALIQAAVALGAFKDHESAFLWARKGDSLHTFLPNKEENSFYTAKYREFLSLYYRLYGRLPDDRSAPVMDQDNTPPPICPIMPRACYVFRSAFSRRRAAVFSSFPPLRGVCLPPGLCSFIGNEVSYEKTKTAGRAVLLPHSRLFSYLFTLYGQIYICCVPPLVIRAFFITRFFLSRAASTLGDAFASVIICVICSKVPITKLFCVPTFRWSAKRTLKPLDCSSIILLIIVS